MAKGSLPPETSLDDLKIRIRESYSNPNVGRIHQVELKPGPRVFRIATLLEVIDPKSGEFHHFSLKIDHIDRQKAGWFAKPERSIRLEGDSPNEIEKLYRFLHALHDGKLAGGTGELHVIRSDDYANLECLLETLPNLAATDKLHLVKMILSKLECQWALKGDQRKALERRPVGLRRDGLLRWVLCRRQAPWGESSWRTDWRWISHRRLRV